MVEIAKNIIFTQTWYNSNLTKAHNEIILFLFFSLNFLAIPPGRQVKFLLGPDHVGSGHEPHPIFCEMEELVSSTSGVKEWKETAR